MIQDWWKYPRYCRAPECNRINWGACPHEREWQREATEAASREIAEAKRMGYLDALIEFDESMFGKRLTPERIAEYKAIADRRYIIEEPPDERDARLEAESREAFVRARGTG